MNDCVPARVRAALANRRAAKVLPRLSDIPIPRNLRPDKTWPPILHEIADHIGAYAALQIVDVLAGRHIHVPINPMLSPFLAIIGEEKSRIMAEIFGAERIALPSAKILRDVRMRQLAALARASRISVTSAASIAGLPRRHMSTLVNGDEDFADYEMIELPEPFEVQLLRAASMIVQQAFADADVPSIVVDGVCSRIAALSKGSMGEIDEMGGQALQLPNPPHDGSNG